jgi:hypothetical protein
MRKKLTLSGSLLVIGAVLMAGCGGNKETEPAVATPTLTFSKDRVPIGSAVTLTYKFVVEPTATFDRDYTVFVHILDPEGEQMWTDDHPPPVPTSKWKAGETIEYKRTIFIPTYPYVGEAIVRLGLYDPPSGKRLVLKAQEASRREYIVAKIQIAPSGDNIHVNYKDGWHPAENDAKNPQNEWQWTKKTSTVFFKNPKKDATIYVEFDGRPDLFPTPQQVTLKIGDQVVGTLTAASKLPTLVTFPLTAAQLGTADTVDLVFDVDQTFKPGGTDPRELGIRVFHIYIDPK